MRAPRSYEAAAIAMMAAFVIAFTYLFQLPDAAVVFVAIAFGPLVGVVAGGLGTAVADLLLGLAAFVPLDLVAYSGEAAIAGLIVVRRPTWLVPAWLAGVAWMLAVNLVGLTALFGWSVAVADVLLKGLGPAAAAGIAGPLYRAVRAAYPPLALMRPGRAWKQLERA